MALHARARACEVPNGPNLDAGDRPPARRRPTAAPPEYARPPPRPSGAPTAAPPEWGPISGYLSPAAARGRAASNGARSKMNRLRVILPFSTVTYSAPGALLTGTVSVS